MGRGGLYYRKTFPSSSSNPRAPSSQPSPAPLQPETKTPTLTDIDSGDIENMVDSSSAELLAEINKKRRQIKFWPYIAVLGFVVSITSLNTIPDKVMASITFAGLVVLTIGLTIWAALKDKVRTTTVLLYDFDPDMEGLYQKLYDALDAISLCDRLWHIEATGTTGDKKYFAGASSIVKKSQIAIKHEVPPRIATNLETPCLPLGRQKMYFFPDKVLIFESRGVGAISYQSLKVDLSISHFVEQERVPSDTKVVGTTWLYVNKNGGPDKRFKDN
jgi:hypothetical protein